MDGKIGQAWIEDFDKKTSAKVRGRRHVLLVDGHIYTTHSISWITHANMALMCCVILHIPLMYIRDLTS